MQFNYLIIEQVIIPFYTILFVFFAFVTVEVVRGYFLRPLVVFLAAIALLILFTDLRRSTEYTRMNFSFDGVIYPTIETIETTMPVIFVEIVETGVITGGCYHELCRL